MKAVGIAAKAARAWAITPAGAIACLRGGLQTVPLLERHDRQSLRSRLHTSSILHLDATASSKAAIAQHPALPVPPGAELPVSQTGSSKTIRNRKQRARRAAARLARRIQQEQERTLDQRPAGGDDIDTGVDASAMSGDKQSGTVSAAMKQQMKEQRKEKRAAKLQALKARRRDRLRTRASIAPTSAYPTGPKIKPAVIKDSNPPHVRDEPPHVGMIDSFRRTSDDVTELPRKETSLNQGSISASDVTLQEIKPARPMKIATLRCDLARVLFSPGVHHLRDPRCGVRNFGESLDAIPKAQEFAAERTPTYVPPSQHQELLDLASRNKAKFIGSTSTLTKAFSQIWFTINGGRELDFSKFSQDFANANKTYTHGAELPAVLVLTPLQGQDADGGDVWAVDSDKAYDIENALSDYGRVLEKQLTAEDDDFARFLRSAPDSAVPQEERTEAEAYRYRQAGSILMRSQLDCHDPRLPGTGVFDIKTRACHPLRHDRANVEQASGHDVYRERGMGNTFERELYDLVRSAMLKFSMQVRIGDMDGIFLAYHNTARMFGFQYLPLSDMDEYLFGSTQLADQAFNLSISIFERIIQHPISMMMYKTPRSSDPLNIYFGPASKTRPTHAIRLRTTNEVNGSPVNGPISFGDCPLGKEWTVKYNMSNIPFIDAQAGFNSCVNMLVAMCTLSVPSGKTVGEMIELSKLKEQAFDPYAVAGSGPAKAVMSGDEGGVEDVLLEGEVSGSLGTARPQNGEKLQDAAGGKGAVAQDGPGKPKVKVRWVAPNGRIQALRREVDASRELYEERTKGWA